jgi:hypothetical protein
VFLYVQCVVSIGGWLYIYVVVQAVFVFTNVDFYVLELEFFLVVNLHCYHHVDELCTVTSFSTLPLNPNIGLTICSGCRLKFHRPHRRYRKGNYERRSRSSLTK